LTIYEKIVQTIFLERYTRSIKSVEFSRDDLIRTASSLGLKIPKNLGDIIYTFRLRRPLPESIRKTARPGMEWIIEGTSKGTYLLREATYFEAVPTASLGETRILNSTPGIIVRYAKSDEQALLARIRYNRLVDTFTGLTCYSLQNHFRTSIRDGVQIETDEIYVGIDKKGVHFVLPVQAKTGKERLGRSQIVQDYLMCQEKFPTLECRCIGAQTLGPKIVLFEFEYVKDEVRIVSEKHYTLVEPDELTDDELASYKKRLT